MQEFRLRADGFDDSAGVAIVRQIAPPAAGKQDFRPRQRVFLQKQRPPPPRRGPRRRHQPGRPAADDDDLPDVIIHRVFPLDIAASRSIYYVYTGGETMQTFVQKWGNSLGVRIPRNLAEDIHVEDGAAVEMRVVEGSLIIAPVHKPTFTLEELVNKITPRIDMT